MRVVDISAWIKWLIDSSIREQVSLKLPIPETWPVPTSIQLELPNWLTREVGEDTVAVVESVLAPGALGKCPG